MKHLLSLLIAACFCCIHIHAQSSDRHPAYLFDGFQDGVVVYKDGRQFSATVNFNLAKDCFVFIDPSGKEEKEFADPQLIGVIRIGNRSFLPAEGSATEVISADPLFKAVYSANMKKAPQKISYGGTTQTASVDNYTGLMGKGLISGAQSTDRIVADIHVSYKVKVGRKEKSFYNKHTFLKLFPKTEREELEKYIDSRQVDFSAADQVFSLYRHALAE